jgi:hypothetical protein
VVLIGLLLVALVCLILGLVLASGPWLIGSLVASAVAGYVLWRQREQIRGRSSTPNAPAVPTASRQTSLVTGTAFAGKTSTATPARPGSADASPAATPDTEVWVVDGLPQYHRKGCGQIEGKDAEAVPFAQAIEDGFGECPTCAPVAAGQVTQVWVLDGRPDYHTEDCARIAHADGEQVPRAQAVEDGFTACEVCHPDRTAAAEPSEAPADARADVPAAVSAAEPTDAPDTAEVAAAEPAAAPAAKPVAAAAPEAASSPPGAWSGDVWVVDGRPRYHLEGCLIIKDQSAEPIPLAQATEDGFMPCSMCEPNVARV